MNNIIDFPERSRILEEASYWLVRLDNGPLTDEERLVFSEWLHTSRHHRDALVDLCGLWDNMEILSELALLFPNVGKVSSSPVKRRYFRPLFVTTAAALILSAGFVIFQLKSDVTISPENLLSYETDYQTAIGEQKSLVLPDGSSMNLNTNSRVVVNYTSKQRGIRLARGEAYFKVVHEPERPFFVHAGDSVIRAVGTAFSVRVKGKNMEITVTDGKVELAPVLANKVQEKPANLAELISPDSRTLLEAGKTAQMKENTMRFLVQVVEPEDISRKLSWQHGLLEFKGETLEEVVNEISRYTDTRIIISDDSIRNIRIGGYFRAGEVKALLSVLENGFPVKINMVSEDLIYLAEAQATD